MFGNDTNRVNGDLNISSTDTRSVWKQRRKRKTFKSKTLQPIHVVFGNLEDSYRTNATWTSTDTRSVWKLAWHDLSIAIPQINFNRYT